MNATQAIADVNSIVDNFLHTRRDLSDELNKQVMIALIFGAMSRYPFGGRAIYLRPMTVTGGSSLLRCAKTRGIAIFVDRNYKNCRKFAA